MKIVVNDFNVISYHERSLVLSTYCKENEYSAHFEGGGFNMTIIRSLKETGKNPVVVTIPSGRRYHVLCKKTRTTYVFTIWLAP